MSALTSPPSDHPPERPPERPLWVYRLGRVPYEEAWALQRALVALRKEGAIPDVLLTLEHPAVVTLGRNAGAASLLLSEEALAARGVQLVVSDRGGDATYHGPGQLVAYPILDLRPDWADVPRFVRALEQVMLDVMASYGLEGGRVEGAPGAWLPHPDRKLGAVGARISRWVTHHGVALNINTDLSHFGLIVPCGLVGKGVSSVARELGGVVDFEEARERLIARFAATFGRARVDRDPQTLPPLAEGAAGGESR